MRHPTFLPAPDLTSGTNPAGALALWVKLLVVSCPDGMYCWPGLGTFSALVFVIDTLANLLGWLVSGIK